MSGEAEPQRHIVIIGNGVAGITTARNVRKRSDHRITVISSESMHYYSRPALMYLYMGHMKFDHVKPYENWFWEKNRIDLVKDYVDRIDTEQKSVHLREGGTLAYDDLVLAVGATHNVFGWPGQDLDGVQGFTNLADLHHLERWTPRVKHAVIVGGGLIGVEVAEMLRSRDIDVTMLVREASYWNNVLPPAESHLVGSHIREHGVDVQWQTELSSINDNGDGSVGSVTTSHGTEIECQLVVLTAGVRPRVDLARNAHIRAGRGILVNDYFETSAPNVYAVGDCAERPNGQVDLLWYTGRAHGKHLARVLTGERVPYEPEPFYNSAKFFDIEYQTYGVVPPDVDDASCFVWKGADGRRLLRIVLNGDRVVAFNAFGLRLRAEVCQRWIAEGATLEHCLRNLRDANFDPEFFQTIKQIQTEAA